MGSNMITLNSTITGIHRTKVGAHRDIALIVEDDDSISLSGIFSFDDVSSEWEEKNHVQKLGRFLIMELLFSQYLSKIWLEGILIYALDSTLLKAISGKS